MLSRPVVVAFLILACVVGQGRRVMAGEAPNIVVFLVDDMGPMDTSVPFLLDADGVRVVHPLNRVYRTPAMERLAASGVRFSQFYAMSVCSPTRTSIITGQNSARHRTTQWVRAEANNRGPFGPPEWRWAGVGSDAVTLPRLLSEAGYRTIHVGKAHFGPTGHAAGDPESIGFDVNIAGCAWGHPGSYYGRDGYGALNGQKARAVPDLEAYYDDDTFLTEALTLEATRAVTESVEAGTPFFLHLAHYAVHAPFQSDPRFGASEAASVLSPKAQAYASLIEGMDKSLGDLLDHLQTLGVASNTLVIFLGDNGSDAPLGSVHGHASSAPLRGKKGTHYEGGMRTPCIVSWAQRDLSNAMQRRWSIAPGAVQSQVSTVMDLFPSCLELAGVPVPGGHAVDGTSLRRRLLGTDDPASDRPFLMHFPHNHRSSYFTVYREGQWKLIYHDRPSMNPAKTRYELFDLAKDPGETTNLAHSHPDLVRTMVDRMTRQLDAEGALFPQDDNGRAQRPVRPAGQ